MITTMLSDLYWTRVYGEIFSLIILASKWKKMDQYYHLAGKIHLRSRYQIQLLSLVHFVFIMKKFSAMIYIGWMLHLGETEPHTKNYSGIYERNHLWYNFKALYPLPQSLLPAIKFAKAQIVLSDSWNFGDINNCFPVCYGEEIGDRFTLGSSKLSEHIWNFKYTPILERFSITYHYEAKNFTDQRVIESYSIEHHVDCKNSSDPRQNDLIHELENHILVFYPGVLNWYEHRHLNRTWRDTQPISLIC
ncbi:MAG: hypothetical protein PG981_001433 [Wolbachia endosymbiont of Ctenocephalides orientis wCori]|nr:MAG: hypothetical protein PG981_001433 [Wolbachia endosymbiont of Ctenocephalides orientis wCori]